jgi:NADH-quinone oxidoreductase subunit J
MQVRGHRDGGGGRIAFDWELLVFLTLSLVTLVSALMVVRTREIVHSVIYLATCFISVAALYVMLSAEFVAIIQILVYVGAVIVVILFGIMLTKREIMESERK